ncbi:SDR family oxidoreductase [Paraburkholderia fynbosensis]|uniref:Aurachin B dehydrogenase n=1 Tax=Paraburkholderia fynbosensis TaxID=1200993 RepID=A0A6J5H5V7_9BURK|nr:SDR family oxidoreductase [Paraburkholderia fynbosensis]CAB3810928.1 Aurachin B dehydrogenase [Paraburkholderia fynbosensis]
MRVFITGATGFIGSAIVRRLVTAGHEVTGLVRSANAAASLEALGARACRGTIEDLHVLRRAAVAADGVIHTAFFHALSQASLGIRVRILFGGRPRNIVERFTTAAVGTERRAIETFGGALEARKGSLIIAFPTMAMASGRPALETDAADPGAVGGLRAQSEKAALDLVATGVSATVVRLPPSVHDETRLGLVTRLIEIARKKRISAYPGDGNNRWAAVHRLDASLLFRLALESGEAGARYHAVAEESIPFRDIAETIGRHLDVRVVPLSTEDAARHFGWLAPFVSADNPVSSQTTRERLGWEPRHPQLMTDLMASLRDVGR